MEYLAEENGLVERSYRLLHMMYQFQDTELKTLIVFVSGMPKPALRISTYFSLMMDSMNLLHSFILGLSRSARALCSYKCSVFLIRKLNIKLYIVMLIAEPWELKHFTCIYTLASHVSRDFEWQILFMQICAVLYPGDATENGKLLRLKQQFLLCSASLQVYSFLTLLFPASAHFKCHIFLLYAI